MPEPTQNDQNATLEYRAYQRGFKDGFRAAKKEDFKQLMGMLREQACQWSPIPRGRGRQSGGVGNALR